MTSKRRIIRMAALAAATLVAVGLSTAMAQTPTAPTTAPAPAAAPAVAPAPTPEECERASLTGDISDFIKKSKQPCEYLKWGADARLREVFTPNLLLDREDRHFQRYRLRTWATVTPTPDVDINVRLVYEPKHFCQPSREAFTRNAAYLDEWTTSEAIVDQLNVVYRKAFGLPVTLKVGRQDIILGDGWLVLDGTPLDGSRTIFFDALRATIDLADYKTKVDVIGICQSADSSDTLSAICDKDFHNIEQDEMGAIVYVSNTSLPKTQIDGYFIYKHDEQVIGRKLGDVSPGNVAPWQVGANADIYTVGMRVAGDITDHWKYRAELAKQCGHKNGRDLDAWGFNSRLSYFCNDEKNNNFRVAYEYLSGDALGSGTDEQFDPLWGRWPQFSELLAYTVALENRPGEQTNLHRVGAGWSFNPCKDPALEFCLDYHLLFRDKKVTSFGRDESYFDNGCFKGQLVTALLKYKFNDHVSGHLIGEVFAPGDFYNDTRNETAGFFRYELTFTW